MFGDTYCSENDLPSNILLSLNGKRKRCNENCIDQSNIKNSDTGRGKRIKKPLNKYDHLDSLLDQEKINSIIKKRKGLKDDIQINDDTFCRKPLSPNGLYPSIDLKHVSDNSIFIDKITNNFSKINGKTYQELKVTDEDGKEEEIYVVDVTSDEEIDNYGCKINNSFNFDMEKSNILNGLLQNDVSSQNLFVTKDSKSDLLNTKSHSQNENLLNGFNNYNDIKFNNPNNLNLILNPSSEPCNDLHKLNISINEDNQFITQNTNGKSESFVSSKSNNIHDSSHTISYSSTKSSSKKNVNKISRNRSKQKKESFEFKNNKNKNKVSKKQSQELSKDLIGPFIRVNKNMKGSNAYQLINSKEQDNNSSFSSFCALNVVECSSNHAASKMSDKISWKCIFCMHPSSYSFLGDLYGPYYLQSQQFDNDLNNSKNQNKRRSFTSHIAATEHGESDWSDNQLPSEIWVHADCVVWTNGISVCGGSLQGLIEAATSALYLKCSSCNHRGATLGCYMKGCLNKYHYLCAHHSDCLFDEDAYSIYCPKHKARKELSKEIVKKPL